LAHVDANANMVFAQSRSGFLRPATIEVGNGHAHAMRCKRRSDTSSDAGSAAGDDCAPAFQV
jgi:hypothetical protein